MKATLSALELCFLGSPEIRLNGQVLSLPTRKALALLAYLACEPGTHPREKLAAMFWSDNDETSGRTALRKALGFLNDALGEAQPPYLKVSRDALGFNQDSNVWRDVFELETSAKLVRSGNSYTNDLHDQLEEIVAGVRGDFLAGFSLPDALEFDDWLEIKRESLRRDLDSVLHSLSRAQFTSNKAQAALATARKRVQLDGMNEAAHRAVIELHLEIGDRAAALEAFKTCQMVLERELGIPPAPETLALAERARNASRSNQLEISPTLPATQPHLKIPTRAAPTSVFVGREREWAMLEDAWHNNLIAYVSGEPGSGKTRLMLEYLVTQGQYLLLENRPGDAGVPYASLARHLRALFKSQAVSFEPWVKTELSRILPELGDAPEAIQSEQGKLHFFQAISQAFQIVVNANNHLTVLLYDDAQFTDTLSAAATQFVLEQLDADTRAQLRIVYGYRKGELSPEMQERVNQTLASDTAVLIELEPLDTNALSKLLEYSSAKFELTDLVAVAESFERFTGGNPFFVLETLRALAELQPSDALTATTFETLKSSNQLPKSAKVNQVILRRLERLSKPAKDLVRVAAVMGTAFTLERAAKVLEANQLVLVEASDELEVGGFVRNNKFVHDLLFETTFQEIPKSAKRMLHSRVLAALEGSDVTAVELFRHAIESEDDDAILAHVLPAHLEARKVWLLDQSIEYLELARNILLKKADQVDIFSDYEHIFLSTVFFDLAYNHSAAFKGDLGIAVLKEYIEIAEKGKQEKIVCIAMIFILEQFRYHLKSEEVKLYIVLILKISERLNIYEIMIRSQLLLGDILSNDHILNENIIEGLKLQEKHAEKAFLLAKEFIDSDIQMDKSISYNTYSEITKSLSKKIYLIAAIDKLSTVKRDLNYFFEAEKLSEEAVLLNSTLDKPFSPFAILFNLGWVKLLLGKISEAEKFSRLAIQDSQRLHPNLRFFTYTVLFEVYPEKGIYYQTLEEIKQIPEDIYLQLKLHLVAYRGKAHSALGDLQTAYTEIFEAENLIRLDPTWCGEGFISVLCSIAVMQSNWDHALQLAHKVIQLRHKDPSLITADACLWHLETEVFMRFNEIDTARADIVARTKKVQNYKRFLIPQLRSEAVLDRHEGKLDIALEKLNRALEYATEIGLPRETWEIQAAIAHLLERQCDNQNAFLARTKALEVRDLLAALIPDETMRQTYLEFTQRQIDVPIWEW